MNPLFLVPVIPAEAGIQYFEGLLVVLDPGSSPG